ncbi:MAG: amidohydrolase family protein, partial [Candidatus Omnitrophica bacterium]|nr:amidohydrolase family protein [Candidatus Omnitrophota bacterium]
MSWPSMRDTSEKRKDGNRMRPVIFTGAKVIDVVSRKVVNTDVLVKDAKTYLGEAPLIQGCEVIDLKGAYLAPGFIDGHIHIESSMLTPIEFSREAVKKGTTAVFCDPHEIANVLGPRGVELFLEQAEQAVIKINIAVPSCVPATDMETSGGAITLDDIKKFLKDERVYGLAEMMNFPGIVHGVGDARQKVKAALDAGKLVDGHAPGLSGKPLEDYISNGEDDWEVRISSDHECTSAQEAIEKWEKGMFIMLRHGSASKDLENILPGICEKGISLENFGLVSDDLSAEDMREKGHVDGLVRAAAQIFENVLG